MKLPYKRNHPAAVPPKFAHDTDACFDLTAATREISGTTAIYDTGLVFDIPAGYMLKVFSRSGHGFKLDLDLSNGTGIIDAGYTDTVKVKMRYSDPFFYQRVLRILRARPDVDWPSVGDRIAQARLEKNVKTDLVEVDEIDKETERGDGGIGSTGK